MNMKAMLTVLAAAAAGLASAADETAAIQGRIDAAWRAGGGTVEVSSGVHPVGGLLLRSNVTLLLKSGAVLKGSMKPEDYEILPRETLQPELRKIKPDRWCNAVIRASGVSNAAVIGEPGSVIDGSNCYDPLGEEHYRGPHGISAYWSTNIVCRGYEMRDIGNWAHCFMHCRNLVFEDVKVRAGHDGVHVRWCDDVTISRCSLLCGDDCVAGCGNRDVTVRDCEINSSCNGFRFGGTRILVERCKAWGPGRYAHRYTLTKEQQRASAANSTSGRRNMLSFFTYFAVGDSPYAEMPGDIVIRDCEVRDVDRLFNYNCSGKDEWQTEPILSAALVGVKASGVKMPLFVHGTKEHPVRFVMRNCDVAFSEPQSELMATAFTRSVLLENVRAGNVTGPACRQGEGCGPLELRGVTGCAGVSAATENPLSMGRY